MEFTVTESKSMQNSQISSLTCLKSMQVTHNRHSQHCKGATDHGTGSRAPQQACLSAVHVCAILLQMVVFFSGWRRFRRKGFYQAKLFHSVTFLGCYKEFVNVEFIISYEWICFQWGKIRGSSWLNQFLDIKEKLYFYKILSIVIFTWILKWIL